MPNMLCKHKVHVITQQPVPCQLSNHHQHTFSLLEPQKKEENVTIFSSVLSGEMDSW
jgi:hypothetical protein